MLTTVLFDVGETLVDETSLWAGWADYLGVPAFTLFGVLGGLAARDEPHERFLEIVCPEADLDELRAGKPPWQLSAADLYPDVVPCLTALREAGLRVVVGGNQPVAVQALVEQLDLPVDLVTSSGTLGAAKPDPEFYRRLAAFAGVDPSECVHVGDRVDNDVVGALAVGMTVVHLRRGPWGHLHESPAPAHRLDGLSELPALLAGLR